MAEVFDRDVTNHKTADIGERFKLLEGDSRFEIPKKYNEYLYKPWGIGETVDIPDNLLIKKLKGAWAKLHRAAINQKNGRTVFGPQIVFCGNNDQGISKDTMFERKYVLKGKDDCTLRSVETDNPA